MLASGLPVAALFETKKRKIGGGGGGTSFYGEKTIFA